MKSTYKIRKEKMKIHTAISTIYTILDNILIRKVDRNNLHPSTDNPGKTSRNETINKSIGSVST